MAVANRALLKREVHEWMHICRTMIRVTESNRAIYTVIGHQICTRILTFIRFHVAAATRPTKFKSVWLGVARSEEPTSAQRKIFGAVQMTAK